MNFAPWVFLIQDKIFNLYVFNLIFLNVNFQLDFSIISFPHGLPMARSAARPLIVRAMKGAEKRLKALDAAMDTEGRPRPSPLRLGGAHNRLACLVGVFRLLNISQNDRI